MSYQQHIFDPNVKTIRLKRLKELLQGFWGSTAIVPDVYQIPWTIAGLLGEIDGCCVFCRNLMDHISKKTASYHYYDVDNAKK